MQAVSLKMETSYYWKVLSELREQADRDYFDEAFSARLVTLCDKPSNNYTSSALFDFLLQLSKKPKFRVLATNLLRRPFGLVPGDSNVGLVKCSMAFANALPHEHYHEVFEAWRERFEKELSFLLVSEEFDAIREGLEVLAERGLLLPKILHTELAQMVEESGEWDFVPEVYVRLCFERELWEDPLVCCLSTKMDVLADCLALKALMQYKNGNLSAQLLALVSSAGILKNLEEREECQFIVKQFEKLILSQRRCC